MILLCQFRRQRLYHYIEAAMMAHIKGCHTILLNELYQHFPQFGPNCGWTVSMSKKCTRLSHIIPSHYRLCIA